MAAAHLHSVLLLKKLAGHVPLEPVQDAAFAQTVADLTSAGIVVDGQQAGDRHDKCQHSIRRRGREQERMSARHSA
mgnify:CR=1 FL=1